MASYDHILLESWDSKSNLGPVLEQCDLYTERERHDVLLLWHSHNANGCFLSSCKASSRYLGPNQKSNISSPMMVINERCAARFRSPRPTAGGGYPACFSVYFQLVSLVSPYLVTESSTLVASYVNSLLFDPMASVHAPTYASA